MASKDEDISPYELLGITIEATESEIKTAYRQRSLKVHPDRHPNNPDAATKFHELNQAYEKLLDPIAKTKLDASLRAKLARKERFAKFDVKRKGMQEELEEAERAVKRAKMDKEKQERERKNEAERIKEEGRRMRQERQDELTRKEEEQRSKDREAEKAFKLGPHDTTIRVKYPLSEHPTLTTQSSLAALLSTFGTIDDSSIVISMRPSKKAPHKPPKFVTALVTFGKVHEAHAAVCASGMETRGLKDVEISWAEGREPALLEALNRNHHSHSDGNEGTPNPPLIPPLASGISTGTFASTPSFSFDPSNSQQAPIASRIPELDYESITLMRLRQAERERLEREIREQETVT